MTVCERCGKNLVNHCGDMECPDIFCERLRRDPDAPRDVVMTNSDLEAIRKACVGKPVGLVRDEVEEKGWHFRIVCQNGKTVVGAADLVPNRINVVVESGVVIEVRCLG